MKKILIAFALVAGSVSLTHNTVQAQVSFSINIGSQPLWGPTGYDYANYYYMPDIDAYYNVANQQFICNDGGRWGYYNQLPARYGAFDLYNGYKVVINDRNPWLRNDYYRNQYRSYRGRRGQGIIRDSRDARYYQIANHPYHNQWRGGRNDGYRGDRGYNGGRNRYEARRDGDGQRGPGYDGRRNGSRNDRWENNNGGDRGGNRTYQNDQRGQGRGERDVNNAGGRGQRGNRGDYSGGDRGGRVNDGERDGGSGRGGRR